MEQVQQMLQQLGVSGEQFLAIAQVVLKMAQENPEQLQQMLQAMAGEGGGGQEQQAQGQQSMFA